jgi:hypothetical protein
MSIALLTVFKRMREPTKMRIHFGSLNTEGSTRRIRKLRNRALLASRGGGVDVRLHKEHAVKKNILEITNE